MYGNRSESEPKNFSTSTRTDSRGSYTSPLLTARHSSPRRVCRICLEEGIEDELIAPCECRGSVKFVHPKCLQHWFEVMRSMHCSICKTAYEKEARGMKPISEWSWPEPVSDAWEDRLDFKCAVFWLIFMSRFVYVTLRDGLTKTNEELINVLGNGVIYRIWLLSFWVNLIYYSGVVSVICGHWKKANSIYEWKNKQNRLATPTPTTQRSNALRTPAQAPQLQSPPGSLAISPLTPLNPPMSSPVTRLGATTTQRPSALRTSPQAPRLQSPLGSLTEDQLTPVKTPRPTPATTRFGSSPTPQPTLSSTSQVKLRSQPTTPPSRSPMMPRPTSPAGSRLQAVSQTKPTVTSSRSQSQSTSNDDDSHRRRNKNDKNQ